MAKWEPPPFGYLRRRSRFDVRFDSSGARAAAMVAEVRSDGEPQGYVARRATAKGISQARDDAGCHLVCYVATKRSRSKRSRTIRASSRFAIAVGYSHSVGRVSFAPPYQSRVMAFIEETQVDAGVCVLVSVRGRGWARCRGLSCRGSHDPWRRFEREGRQCAQLQCGVKRAYRICYG